MPPKSGRTAAVVAMGAILVLAACSSGNDRPPTTTTTTSSTVATTSTTTAPSTTGPSTTESTPPPTTVRPTTTSAPAPPPVTGLAVSTGAGSGEVDITWPPLPASADVASYKLYKRRADGTELAPAAVTSATLGMILPGRLGITDAPDAPPWPTTDYEPGPRCYRVSAVSTGGVEGPLSAEACGSPVGG